MKELDKDGDGKLFLYAYGAYGIAIPPTFSTSRQIAGSSSTMRNRPRALSGRGWLHCSIENLPDFSGQIGLSVGLAQQGVGPSFA